MVYFKMHNTTKIQPDKCIHLSAAAAEESREKMESIARINRIISILLPSSG